MSGVFPCVPSGSSGVTAAISDLFLHRMQCSCFMTSVMLCLPSALLEPQNWRPAVHKATPAVGPLFAYCGGRGGGPHLWNVHRRGSCEGWLRETKHASSVSGPLEEGGTSSWDLEVGSPKAVFTGHQEGPCLPLGAGTRPPYHISPTCDTQGLGRAQPLLPTGLRDRCCDVKP